MFPAVPEDVVVYEIKLHASSWPVDHKRHVICLHDLVIPELALPQQKHKNVSALVLRQRKFIKLLQNVEQGFRQNFFAIPRSQTSPPWMKYKIVPHHIALIVICHIPDSRLKSMAIWIILNEDARMFYWNPRMRHRDGVQCTIIVLPIFIPTITSKVRLN